jgi:hypothetical protein
MPNCCPSFCSKRSTISNYFIKSSHYQKLSGTSFGYSTIYLAEAARANSGRVTTLDYDVAKQVQASAYIQQVGLQEVVDFKLGDAMELLDGLPGHFSAPVSGAHILKPSTCCPTNFSPGTVLLKVSLPK